MSFLKLPRLLLLFPAAVRLPQLLHHLMFAGVVAADVALATVVAIAADISHYSFRYWFSLKGTLSNSCNMQKRVESWSTKTRRIGSQNAILPYCHIVWQGKAYIRDG